MQVNEFRRLNSSTFRQNSAEQVVGDLDGGKLDEEERLEPSYNRKYRLHLYLVVNETRQYQFNLYFFLQILRNVSTKNIIDKLENFTTH